MVISVITVFTVIIFVQLFVIAGLDKLVALESLSLAYNLLSSEEVCSFDFGLLNQLKVLDLGRNVLDRIPENICKISRSEKIH